MTTVNVHEAKTHLSRILEQVEGGEEIVIARAGHPVARLIPFESAPRSVAPPGSLAGSGFWIADDFDAPVNDLFEALGTTR